MRILFISDVENKGLWDFYTKEKTEGIDCIISCGDLHPDYLQFLVTMASVPLFYVRGNHDHHYDNNPPLGCIPIDDKVIVHKGLRIGGLGGCMRYNQGKDMYTEKEMRKRTRSLELKTFWKRGIDILVTHAPAAGYGDLEDLPHKGFECFNDYLNKWNPKYMVHGHVHKEYGGKFIREYNHPSGCTIINCYDTYVMDVKTSGGD
ncbi:MAG: metallophosphoesterase [Lachnospiraceae bacterium]|nr:metallophosphoesterase [Lachnospiraceae bacterium]